MTNGERVTKEFERPVPGEREISKGARGVEPITTTVQDKSKSQELEASGYTRETTPEGYTLSAPVKEFDSAYYYKDKTREKGSYSDKVYEFDKQGNLVKETTYAPKTTYATSGFVLREVKEVKSVSYEESQVIETTQPKTQIEGSLTIPERERLSGEEIGGAGAKFETSVPGRLGYAGGGLSQITTDRPQYYPISSGVRRTETGIRVEAFARILQPGERTTEMKQPVVLVSGTPGESRVLVQRTGELTIRSLQFQAQIESQRQVLAERTGVSAASLVAVSPGVYQKYVLGTLSPADVAATGRLTSFIGGEETVLRGGQRVELLKPGEVGFVSSSMDRERARVAVAGAYRDPIGTLLTQGWLPTTPSVATRPSLYERAESAISERIIGTGLFSTERLERQRRELPEAYAWLKDISPKGFEAVTTAERGMLSAEIGVRKGIREKPVATGLTFAAFFVLPAVLGGIGLGARVIGLPRVAGALKAAPVVGPVLAKGGLFISQTVRYGIPTVYGLSAVTRIRSADNQQEAFGRILGTEVAPMLAGGAVGGLLWPKLAGYGRTQQNFLKSIREAPETIRGRTYFGEAKVKGETKAPITKVTERTTVTVEEALPYETRVAKVPKEVATIAAGPKTFSVKTPEGTQYTTIKGTGPFKDLSLQIRTDPVGESVAKLLKTTSDKIPSLEVVKILKFKSPKIVAGTEPVDIPGLRFFEELKLTELTTRVEQVAQKGKFVATTEQPVSGEFIQFRVQETGVVTKQPKLDIRYKEGVLDVDIYRTEFELVDFPPKPEPTTITKMGLEFPDVSLTANKAIEFLQRTDLRFAQRFEIRYGEPPKTPKLAEPPTPPDVFLKGFEKTAETFRASKAEVTKSFQGEAAQTLDVRPQMIREATEMLLKKLDPYGISGDRLRLNLLEEVSVTKVTTPDIMSQRISQPRMFLDRPPAVSLAQPTQILRVPLTSELRGLVPVSISENILQGEILSRQENRLLNETINRVLNEAVSKSVSESLSKSFNETISESLSETMTLTLTQALAPTQAQTLTPTGTAPPSLGPGIRGPPGIIPGLLDLGGGRLQEVYDVFVRESYPKGGKVERVKVTDEPIPKHKAQNLGGEYTDNSSARTFDIVPAGQAKATDDIAFFKRFKFGNPSVKGKIKPDSFVEKTAFLIDTPGEIEGISARGWKARREQSRNRRSLF